MTDGAKRIGEDMILTKGRRAALWGAGNVGSYIYRKLNDAQSIECFIDSNPSKRGSMHCGKEIRSPDFLKNESEILVLITTADDIEIVRYLEQFGAERKITYKRLDEIWDLFQKVRWTGEPFSYEAPSFFFSRPSHEEVATRLIRQGLDRAFQGATSDLLHDVLKNPKKPGTICALFPAGRSGSALAVSFFAGNTHPQILSVPGYSLSEFDRIITYRHLADFPGNSLEQRKNLFAWTTETIKKTLHYGEQKDDTRVMRWTSERDAFTSNGSDAYKHNVLFFLLAQLLYIEGRSLNHELLLKMLYLAIRGADGKELGSRDHLAYIWNSHSSVSLPNRYTPRWILDNFSRAKVIFTTRLPEKNLDSTFVFTRLRQNLPQSDLRFCLQAYFHFTRSDLSEDERVRVIRFEDMHKHTEELLDAWCDWLDVKRMPGLAESKFAAKSGSGLSMQGTRRLSASDMLPYCFSFADVLKLRFFLQEEYREWHYDDYMTPSLEQSLAIYRGVPLVADLPFSGQCVYEMINSRDETGDPALSKNRHDDLMGYLRELRMNRDAHGFAPVPLLYRPETFNNKPPERHNHES